MDHLKTPSQIDHSIQVPFHGQFYDGLGLEGFPKRRHWNADSWLSRPPQDLDERVSCKGAIAYFENMLECMHESVRQIYGQKIEYYIAILNSIYDMMCQDARAVRSHDASLAARLPSMLSGLDDLLNAAQILRLRTWLASSNSTCRVGKAEERFSIRDALAFLVDHLIRMYEEEEEPDIESCRELFQKFQDKIKTMHKIAMLAPDDLKGQSDFDRKCVQSMENFSYKSREYSWCHTDIDKSMMAAYCLDGDFDALPGDTYYDGRDPEQHLNWTTDFAAFDVKQRRDRAFVQSSVAALTDKILYNSNGIKQLKTSFRDFLHGQRVQRTSNTEPSEKKSEEQGATNVRSSSRMADANLSAKRSQSPEPSEAETSAFPAFPFRLAARTIDANPEEVCTQDDQMCRVVKFLSDSSEILPDPKFKKSDAMDENDFLSLRSFLQAWLFFGTLDEVFKIVGISVNQQDFVRLQDQNEILTTTMLESYIDQWSLRERSVLLESSRVKRAINIRGIIDRQIISCNMHDHKDFILEPFNVCFPASVLCLSLQFAWHNIYTPSVSLASSTNQTYRVESKYLRARFLEAGWCVNKIESISNSWPLTLQYFTLQLGRLSSAKDHSYCFRNHCIANHIDEATYETKHLNSPYCSCSFLLNCTCYSMRSKDEMKVILESSEPSDYDEEFIQTVFLEPAIAIVRSSPNMFRDGYWQASSDKIADIVREGSFPLITMVNPSIQPYDVEPQIIKYEPGIAYIAISHVWADGLGNTRRNSLPLCQLITLRARLFKLMEIYGLRQTRLRPVVFWIDTLCVPLTPKVIRRKAITKMQDVYRQSMATLVLDAGLMQHSCPLDPLEVLVRVQTSDWSQRLWTYQEAALAPRIYFQFQDTCSEEIVQLMNRKPHDSERANGGYGITRRDLQITWYPSFSIESRSDLVDVRGRDVIQMFSLYSPKEKWHRFYTIWRGLQQRSTSREFDQIICLAVLLGVDIEAILGVEEERPLDRMKVLLKKIAVFPAGIVFVATRRMNDDGFTWAPLSMLREVEHIDRILLTEDTSTLSDKGLQVKFAGLVFPGNSVQILPVDGSRYYTWVADSEWTKYLKENTSAAAIYEPEVYYGFDLELPGYMQSDWSTHPPDTYAILFQEAIMPQARRTSNYETAGALVSICAQEDGVYHVVLKCTVRVLCMKEKKTSVPREPAKDQTLSYFTLTSSNKNGRVLGDGMYTMFDQQWVIR